MTTSPRSGAIVVSWKDLPRWDFKTARAAAFRLSHPSFRLLGDFIEEATELVRPSEQPDKEWPVFGVTNKDGVVFSHYQKGFDFNAPYKRIKQDWFFHNPTRANVGSLGRVPAVPPDALTSPEYQVWRIRGGLLPEYVEILIQTSFFIELIDFHRVGAVKERLFTRNLMEIPIPVLSESKQLRVISRWRQNRAEVSEIQRRIEQIGRKITSCFSQALGLTHSTGIKNDKCFGVRWKDLQRWSVSYNQAVRTGVDLSQGKYPLVDLGSVLELVQYGTSEKANTERRGIPILRMNNIVDGILSTKDLKHIELPERESTRLFLQDGDILFNRTNSKELVGKCAVFHEKDDYVFASYLIRLRVNPEKILPDFLVFAMNSKIGRAQIDALSRQIIGQANVNTDELRSLQIPLPPLSVQYEILERIEEGRTSIEHERQNADHLAATTKQEIEEMILGTKPVPEINDQQKLSA